MGSAPARRAWLLAIRADEAPHLIVPEGLVEDALAYKVKDAAAACLVQPIAQLLAWHILVIVQLSSHAPPAAS